MPIKEIKGYDILPLIKDPAKPETIREATVHHSIRGEFAIRRGKWKLLCSPRSGGWSYPKPNADKEAIASSPLIQLYDMDQDPGEKHNVYKEHPEYTYYWGAAWDKADIKTADAWNEYVAAFAQKLRAPLTVTVQ